MKSVILFDQIVKVFDLSQFHVFREVSFCLEFFEGFQVGRVFVHVDDSWFAGMRGGEGFEQELLGRLRIPCRTEEEIKRMTM
jgi:hypothetical protein